MVVAPVFSFEVVGVVLEVNAFGFLAAISDQVDVLGAIAHRVVEFMGRFVEGVGPEVAVEGAVVEVVGAEEHGVAANMFIRTLFERWWQAGVVVDFDIPEESRSLQGLENKAQGK